MRYGLAYPPLTCDILWPIPHALGGLLASHAPRRTRAGEVRAASAPGGLLAGHAPSRTPRWASSALARSACCISAGRAAHWPRAWGGVGRSHGRSAAYAERDLGHRRGRKAWRRWRRSCEEQASKSAVAQRRAPCGEECWGRERRLKNLILGPAKHWQEDVLYIYMPKIPLQLPAQVEP